MYREITAANNKNIKHLKSLNKKKYRDIFSEYLIEGIKILEEAISCKENIKTVIINDKFINMKKSGKLLKKLYAINVDVYKLPDKVFESISNTENSQGIVGVVGAKRLSIKQFIEDVNPSFLIFCENINDPGNMGTIIRTADASGVEAVIVSKGCVDIYSPKTVRSTMGSLFHLPVIKVDDTLGAISYLKAKGFKIICTYLTNAEYYYNINIQNKSIIIIGNEANGVSERLKAQADCLVKIPILGKAESLNVAVASGILMYEVARRKWTN